MDFSVNPDLSPKAPNGWELTQSEPVRNGDGYMATYRNETNGMHAELSLYSRPDTTTVEVTLDDYTNPSDLDTSTRRYERTVPVLEDIDTLNEIATEWVEKAEAGEL